MLEKFLEKSMVIFKKPKTVIFLFLLISFFITIGFFKIKIDNDIVNFVPQSNKVKETFIKYEKIFGNSALIFVGIENPYGIYNKETFEYVKFLTNKIKEINNILPKKNISKLLDISEDKATKIINIISESIIFDKDEVKRILTNKEILINQYSFSEEEAGRIVKRVRKFGIDKILKAYEFPLKDVLSIVNAEYIQGEKDKFVLKKILPDGEINDENIKYAKQILNSWDIYKNVFISSDDSLTSIIIQLKELNYPYREEIYKEIKNIIYKSKPQNIKIYFSGEPVIADSVSEYMVKDITILIPLAFLVLIISLFFSFKRIEGVVYPLLIVILSVILTIGIMAYLDIPLNMLTDAMPVILLAVGSAYGIHLINNFLLNIKNKDKLEAIEVSVKNTGVGIVMAAVTTIAGFASLVTTNLLPIKYLGIFTALGVFWALIITIYLIPPIIIIFERKAKRVINKSESIIVKKLLEYFSAIIKKYDKTILLVTILFIILIVVGIFRTRVEMNLVTFFHKNSEVRKSDDVLNRKLAGTSVYNIIIESRDNNSIAKPEILNFIENYQRDVTKNFKIVRKVISINDYIKKMHKEMNGGKEEYYKIPDKKENINDYLMLYSGDLDSYITSQRDKIRISLSLARASTKETEKLKNFTDNYFRNFEKQFNLNVISSGIALIYSEVNRIITWGQISSLILAILIVFGVNFFEFRNFVLSLISIIPIIISLIVNFGLMGFLGISINAGTAMIASVAIGIGVDYAIHMLVKYIKERKNKIFEEAINITIKETGEAIIYNVLSVSAGFLVLVFSRFLPLVQFGVFVAVNMIVTGLGALIIIPIILKFLKKSNYGGDAL